MTLKKQLKQSGVADWWVNVQGFPHFVTGSKFLVT